MSRNFLGPIDVQTFERIIHFLQENNIPTTQIVEINFDGEYVILPIEDIRHNFDVQLPIRATAHVNWADIDHVNNVIADNYTIQILDVVQLPKDERKTVFYIHIPKPEVD